jgi:putative transposase
MEFMSRLHKGEKLTDLCVEYGVSRKTGHKLKQRYEQLGVLGLLDQSRAPKHIPHKTPPEVIELLVAERGRHASWGTQEAQRRARAATRPRPAGGQHHRRHLGTQGSD